MNNESGMAVDEVALAELARAVLDKMKVTPLADLSVLLIDDAAMATLHEQWMDLPGPTDVMAFPMDTLPNPAAPAGAGPGADQEQGPAMLGDIVLCPQVAAKQAAGAGHSTEAELYLLTTHGLLHLLGYDHGSPEEETEMFELQSDLVTSWARATQRGPVRTPRAGTGGEQRQ